MQLYILLLLVSTAVAQQRCSGVRFNGKFYNVDTIKEGFNKIHKIVLHRNDNTLYFTFDQISKVPTMVLGYLNLDTGVSGLVEGIRNATAVTVDQVNNIVYVGGSDGVYRLDSYKQPISLPIRDSIQNIFCKNVLFYTNDRNEAFFYRNGLIYPVFELQGTEVENLILDDDRNIFFTKDQTIFKVKIGTKAHNSLERYKVSDIAVDNNFKPYFCTKDGLYVYNKYKYVLDKVSDLVHLRGLTFSKSNEPIFGILDTIYKLNMSTDGCINVSQSS